MPQTRSRYGIIYSQRLRETSTNKNKKNYIRRMLAMTNIKINYKNSTIEITKAFSEKAGKYGSKAYNDLQDAMKKNPGYTLTIKANSGNNSFKGMDYNFMIEYIQKHDNADTILDAFNKLKASELTYGEIKQWFISTYPVFKDCKTRADWVLAS
jgi:hypothetical protein